MPDLYLGISHASYDILNVESSSYIKNIDDFVNLSRLMYNKVAEKGDEVLQYAGRSVEFHSFGVVGAPGGELLAPMIYTISHFGQFFSKLVNAKNGLIIGGVPEVIFASTILDKVYTANTTPIGIASEFLDFDAISNLEILKWNEIIDNLPEIDIANILLNNLVDDNLTVAVCNAIKPGGLFIVTNASNGSDLYNDSTQRTFSEYVHNLIMESGNFSSYHIQGYTSFTCYQKDI